MALHIKPTDGPSKNNVYLLRDGFVIGRNEGDLRDPNDSRMSGRHAFVESDDYGSLYLVDNNSKNGVRLDGDLVDRVKLVPGIKLTIGTYTYEIIDQNAEEMAAGKPKARHWQEVLVDFGKKSLAALKNEKRPIVPLHPAVVLDFVRGRQAETRWVLGFGPRKVGARSIDLPIFEPGAPDVCFEILPTPDGISFKTDHPEMVKLNGQAVPAEILHIADVIKIQETEIEVDFIE